MDLSRLEMNLLTTASDLINRETFKAKLNSMLPRWDERAFGVDEGLYKAINALNEAPSVAAEPIVEAHWIYSPCDGVWTTACSHCGYEETGESMRKYKGCPMCRAKMTHIECVGHRKEIECRINSANGF